MTAIQLIALTMNGEEAINKYVAEVQSYAKAHSIRTKLIERAKNKLVTEEFFENPMRIVVTIKKEDVNLAIYIDQIKRKLDALMLKYNVSQQDYLIEVL